MKSTRKVRLRSDVRALTEPEIQGLSDHGLRAYRTKVLAFRELAHEPGKPQPVYCCGTKCPTVIGYDEPEPLTERQVRRIKKMDFLAFACNREWKLRGLGRR